MNIEYTYMKERLLGMKWIWYVRVRDTVYAQVLCKPVKIKVEIYFYLKKKVVWLVSFLKHKMSKIYIYLLNIQLDWEIGYGSYRWSDLRKTKKRKAYTYIPRAVCTSKISCCDYVKNGRKECVLKFKKLKSLKKL